MNLATAPPAFSIEDRIMQSRIILQALLFTFLLSSENVGQDGILSHEFSSFPGVATRHEDSSENVGQDGILSQQKPNHTNVAIAKPEDDFETKQREGLSKNPEGVVFTLRLAGGKTQFKRGEAIGLVLEFSSSLPKTFRMEGATYDRSGRLDLDKFHLDRQEGIVDPMRDYRRGMGGGLRSDPDLSEKPSLIHYDLNEWFRFDRVGTYRLYLTSPRVYRIQEFVNVKRESLAVTSNLIEFEVVASDPEWASAQFEQALRTLDSKEIEAYRAASRVLRFLGTKEAIREMVRRLCDQDNPYGFEFRFGLTGAPQRDFVIEEMEERLVAADQPVTSDYLNLLMSLKVMPQFADYSSDRVRQDPKLAEDLRQRWNDAHSQVEKKYLERLAASVTRKNGKARAVTISTLLEQDGKPIASSWKLPEVSAIFNELPIDTRYGYLLSRWKRIASPSMLPILRQIYEHPPQIMARDLCTIALRRIYDLSPEEGRKLILAEIQRPTPRVSTQTLRMLPEQTLPELDNVLAENLEKEDGDKFVISDLIERYASPSILPRVRLFMEEKLGRWACDIQSSLLAYSLRSDPSSGGDLLRRAMQLRKDTGCYRGLLRDVAKRHSNAELEQAAIEFLDDPDLEVVIDAVMMLGQYGSAAAEDALWRRLEEWREQWAGRSHELLAAQDDAMRRQGGLEFALRTAISHSPAWLADARKLERLKQLCVTEEERRQVDNWKTLWTGEIRISYSPNADRWGSAMVAQYESQSLAAMKEKLLQFPKGTTFRWMPTNPGYLDEERETVYVEVKAFLEGRGMKLVR